MLSTMRGRSRVSRHAVRKTAIVTAAVLFIGAAACGPIPGWAAGGLLHPSRRVVDPALTAKYGRLTLHGDGVVLEGWKLPARGTSRGTIVYLHGVADNRGSSLGAARFTERGFDVVAYDSRAHGNSGGDACTYGFYEKRDLRRVLDMVDRVPIVVMGSSLGAAVALQAAAEDERIRGVVAAESFSDLKTIATERAPRFLTQSAIRKAFVIAETEGHFVVDEVSPVRAAPLIKVPVLLLHGALDRETPSAHSQRIFDALGGPRKLSIVDGAGHNQALGAATWPLIDEWLDEVLAGDHGKPL
jgi:pimeloyl-ACP methyl ester carboxylesterase